MDDDTNKAKGDAKLSYQKIESLELAMELLNDREIRPGYNITVEEAHFE